MKTWDIFCHVVDNYGDIGVTFRLARQLSQEFNQSVRLFVDDLASLKRLCPDIDLTRDSQQSFGIEIHRWHPELQIDLSEIVIEAFGCSLSESLISSMTQRTPASIWINLEYLSAEAWVEDCHLLPSPQLQGPNKYFFFPGFTKKTGGLLRENNLLNERHQFTADKQAKFLQQLGIKKQRNYRLISLFTYENPQLGSWLDALVKSGEPYHLLVPPGRIEKDLLQWLNIDALVSGESVVRERLKIQAIPFLSQQEYDRLLWSCDLNFVRGEDSFVRAQWAGKPFIWHIYPQDEDVHLEKLSAFMDRYLHDLGDELACVIRNLWMNWNKQYPMQQSWDEWQTHTKALEAHATLWCDQLAQQKSLAKLLVEFTENC